MTHSSNIPVSQELESAFGTARMSGGETRFLIARISDDDKLEMVKSVPDSGGDLEEEYNFIADHLVPKTPCYVFFRLDETNPQGQHNWLFIAYVPDGSKVRDRMLYASTRDICKRQLGYTYFTDELYGSNPGEVDWESYQDHLTKHVTEAPLTAKEVQVRSESLMHHDPGHTREYVHSVQFPISREAVDAIGSLGNGSVSLVQLRVESSSETIELAATSNTTLDQFPSQQPAAEPRFNIFRWPHMHNGEKVNSIVFVYYCPDGAKIKERMLASTVKAPAIAAAEKAGVTIEKKIEITEADELNEGDLLTLLHPPEKTVVKRITRPSRPGRGPSRMTRKTKA
eukprot:TRINITY_DN10922_c0_g1_i1.p1 TRINITY_DN10922_c0_g1~~TRINITY_DN10922_c0_g1_i1.p1  ORF type:complete len:349 (+),score=94.36 TRINITY_DN10922_c0_g1_i1:25-1047(+)